MSSELGDDLHALHRQTQLVEAEEARLLALLVERRTGIRDAFVIIVFGHPLIDQRSNSLSNYAKSNVHRSASGASLGRNAEDIDT